MRNAMGRALKLSSLLCTKKISLLQYRPLIQSNPNPSFLLHIYRTLSYEADYSLKINSNQRILSDEWVKFLNYLYTQLRSNSLNIEEEISLDCSDLSEDFKTKAAACLAFASQRPDLLRSLSSQHVKVLVESGSPFVFKNESDCTRRMKLFVEHSNRDMSSSEMANTSDLMKYLVSYAWKFMNSIGASDSGFEESVKTSFSCVLDELIKISDGSIGSGPVDSSAKHARFGCDEPQKSWQQSIEMKKGDWICSKCNFMNFARNVKCRECNEVRPKKELTGGDWECLQCGFINYARNIKCLRCDYKRPEGIQPSHSQSPALDQILYSGSADKAEIERRLAENDEKAERWFNKISQLEDTSDLNAAIADEDFPEIMPLRKGMNRFVVSTRKTPLERKLANSQLMGNNKMTGSAISETLDRILSSSSSTSPAKSSFAASYSENKTQHEPNRTMTPESVSRGTEFSGNATEADAKKDNKFRINMEEGHSVVAPPYRRRIAIDQANNPNFIPFVPFPPDYFAKSGSKQSQSLNSKEGGPPQEIQQRDSRMSSFGNSPPETVDQSGRYRESSHGLFNYENAGQREQSQSLRQKNWDSRREVQQGVNGMNNRGLFNDQISGQSDQSQSQRFRDWDPHQEPQQNGRSSHGPSIYQTSSYTEKNQSPRPRYEGPPEKMQQTVNRINSHEFSNDQLLAQSGQIQIPRTKAWGPPQEMQQNTSRLSNHGFSNDQYFGQTNPSQSPISRNWDPPREMPQRTNRMSSHGFSNSQNFGQSSQNPRPGDWDPQEIPQRTNGMSNHGFSNNQNFDLSNQNPRSREWDPPQEMQERTNTTSDRRLSDHQNFGQSFQSQNPPREVRETVSGANSYGFGGRSLEGSAVTDPDPLDMSEEAKAQRWFRRVSQIKDISELSNIPDEDFPEIMPLRKGVNRFVVSKRKTPMERRLTSPQYRRNLPIISSPDPEKDPTQE